ncbi:MAG: shikimate dehydrogenase [Alphaproteobacteria bacterium]|nr:shikimate dehydrogenase [Alphaproteobacteria bacterium]
MPLKSLLDYLKKEHGLKITKTGVIGHPIAHSKSPLIHEFWIKKNDLAGHYKAIDIAPESLEKSVNELIEQGYKGFNVTVPHKVAIMELCSEVDNTAKTIGAVNTVFIKNGKLSGSNTDAFGFIQNIRENAPDYDFGSGPALVLGAGGAARAVIYGLLEAGAPEIILTNRTLEKAQELAGHFSDLGKITVIDWDKREDALAGIALIVNTTSLGMNGKAPLEISLERLPQEALVCDIVYAPLMTALLEQAKARGNKIVTGIGMLLHQARPGFELWHGIMPEVTEELERLVLK